MKEKPPATIRTIALKAGVARSTVSMALRNHPGIPPATRERIQAVARELQYYPNAVMSTIMARVKASRPAKERVPLAFLNAYRGEKTLAEASTIFTDYLQGASERAEALGFVLDEIHGNVQGMTSLRLTKILHTRNIQGVLLGPLKASRGHLSLDWSNFSLATVGYSVSKPEISRAVTDHFQGTMLLLRNLRKLGYRRLGLVMKPTIDERTNHLIVAGLLVEQSLKRTRSLGTVPPLIISKWSDWKEKTFRTWLLKHKPDVVLDGNPQVKKWIENAGLRIPQDIGFVTLQRTSDDPNDCAGIHVNAKEVGAAAIDIIVIQLHNNKIGIPKIPRTVLIKGEWRDGKTVRSLHSWTKK